MPIDERWETARQAAEEARKRARKAELDPEAMERVSRGEMTSAELEVWRKAKAWGTPGKRMAEFS